MVSLSHTSGSGESLETSVRVIDAKCGCRAVSMPSEPTTPTNPESTASSMSAARPQAHMLRSQRCGSTCSVAGSGPQLVTVTRMA